MEGTELATAKQQGVVISSIKEGYRLWSQHYAAFVPFVLAISLLDLIVGVVSVVVNSGAIPDMPAQFLYWGTFLATRLAGIWLTISIIALILLFARGSAGKNIRRAFTETRKWFLSYFAVSLIQGMFLIGLLVVPATMMVLFANGIIQTEFAVGIFLLACVPVVGALVYYGLRFALGGIACVTDNLGPIQGLKESYRLVGANINALVGCLALLAFLGVVLLIPLGILQVDSWLKMTLSLLYQLAASCMIMPWFIGTIVLLYAKFKGREAQA